MSDLRVLLRVLGLVCGVLPAMAPPQAGRAQAQQVELQKLTPSDLAEGGGNGFGRSVAIWREYIVVGAERDAPPDDPGLASGAVYAYQFEDGLWVERAKLKGSETGWEDQLGWSVAIDRDVIVAGAPHFTTEGSGLGAAAYVFRRDDNGTPANLADDVWHEEAILAPDPSDRQFSDGFGGSVAVSGDTIVAGAAGAGIDEIIEFERAYVFRWEGADWVQEAILVGSDTVAGDRFGISVSITGASIVAGAVRGPEGGAAYVYRGASKPWEEETKLDAQDIQESDLLGSRVSVSGNALAVGAYRREESGLFSGRAYVFRRNRDRWTAEANLAPLHPQHGDAFGSTVGMSAASLVVGARADAHAGMHSGAAYLFKFDGTAWEQQHKLLASDAQAGAQFGRSVAVSGAYALVGGPGAAYVYLVVGDRLSLAHYAEFQNCYTGSGTNRSCACDAFDLVPDGKVDLKDYANLLKRLSGP